MPSPGTPVGCNPAVFPELLQAVWAEGELPNLLGEDHPCDVKESELAKCWPSPNSEDFLIDPLHPNFQIEAWAQKLMAVYGWIDVRHAKCVVFWCLRNLWPIFIPFPDDPSEQWDEEREAAILDWIRREHDSWCAPVVGLPDASIRSAVAVLLEEPETRDYGLTWTVMPNCACRCQRWPEPWGLK
jgi:hypothetical protein